jgi:hypothetical protein
MSENPLRQYFRRPAIYFKLPSEGKYYPPGVVDIPPNGELPVYPMTTRDEILVRTPDGLYNGASVVEVIKNCVPGILNPWLLNTIDTEAVIIAIRAASVDGKMDISSTCPSCEQNSEYSVNLLSMLGEKVDIDYTTPLEIGELEVKFRALTYQETNQNQLKQLEVQRIIVQLDSYEDGEAKQTMIKDGISKLNVLMNDILVQTIEYIKTPETIVTDSQFIKEFLEECDAKTSKIIKDHSVELKQKNESRPIKMTCIACKHQYEQPLTLNFTDFFA